MLESRASLQGGQRVHADALRLANWLKGQGWAEAPRLDKVLGRDAASTETGATEPASEASIAIAAMSYGTHRVATFI